MEDISVVTSRTMRTMTYDERLHFAGALDKLGVESGIAQELNGPITSVDKLIEAGEGSSGHVLLVYSKNKVPLGFLKYGVKILYFYSKKGVVSENETTCLLDFYVSTALQRGGIGSLLFKEMLKILALPASALAYDRPSSKLTAFLAKHYGLTNADLQPNRYAIFPEGFMDGRLNDKK